MRRNSGEIFLAFCLLAQMTAQACAIPVFQYAMEKWPASPYQVIIYHRGGLNAEQQSLLKKLGENAEQTGAANFNIVVVDLANEKDESYMQIWSKQGGLALPAMVVCYPETRETAGPAAPAGMRQAWSGAFSEETAGSLLDSPARREIVRQLKSGTAAVWVLLESGDQAQDRSALDALNTLLPKQAHAFYNAMEPDENGQPEKTCSVSFSSLRVSAKDPAESFFVNILRGIEDRPLPVGKCAAIPVFGRGRALGILPSDRLNEDVIETVCDFIGGSCSCQVKDANPGMDLLLKADWEKESKDPAPSGAQPKLPPLVSLNAPTNSPAPPNPVKPATLSGVGHSQDAWQKNLLWAGAGLLALVIGATLAILWRSNRSKANR